VSKTLVNAYRFEKKPDVISTNKVLDIDRSKFPESSLDKFRSENWIPIFTSQINFKIYQIFQFILDNAWFIQ